MPGMEVIVIGASRCDLMVILRVEFGISGRGKVQVTGEVMV